jgi:hypothetical protein
MAKLSGFRDPVRRPRFIIWTVVIVMILIVVMVLLLGFTSTRFFCSQLCHKVMDDSIHAYEASAHSEISCMACHEPANADPITFMLKKVNSLGEVWYTVTNTYSLPLNPGSTLSLNPSEMGTGQCTQCHSSNREVTPSAGILIDHEVHAKAGVWCTACHNRTAHNEDKARPTGKNPDGSRTSKHPDYMSMDACFRCHDLQGGKLAPGTCATCHTAGFGLIPASHEATGWATSIHPTVAGAMIEEYRKALKEAPTLRSEMSDAGVSAPLASHLSAPVFECYTCHVKTQFCDPCHKRNNVSASQLPQ